MEVFLVIQRENAGWTRISSKHWLAQRQRPSTDTLSASDPKVVEHYEQNFFAIANDLVVNRRFIAGCLET